jgi:uncharacterized protein
MQIQYVFVFTGLLTLACRQPDRQSPADPSARAPAQQSAPAPPSTQPNAEVTHKPACVVPMADLPLPQATAAAHCPAAPEPAGKLDRGQIRFDDASSRPSIEVEVARTDESRQRGLMYRQKLASESGMLFVWDDETFRAFWMRNTCIPLDMLFISKDKTIVGVLEQVPVLNEEPRSMPCPAAYVLEVNAGWVRGHKVAPGQHLTISIP